MSELTSPPPSGRRRLHTVGEVIEEYMRREPGATKGRAGDDRRVRLLAFKKDKGDTRIDDLINDDLEAWIEAHPTWVSPWTRMDIATTIKRPFSWAWKKGLIDRHPLIGVTYPAGDCGQPITDEHFRLLLRNTSAEYRRVLLFLSWTGCRPCELSAMMWENINVEKRIAVLVEHKTAKSRKDRAPRIICLPEKAIRLLTWLLDDQRDEQRHVFLNRKGLPWKSGALGARICRLRGPLGIPDCTGLYGLRHAFATKLCMAGVELKTLATLMGHSTVKMCEQHYIHLANKTDHLLNALEKGLAHKPTDPKQS